MKKMSAMKEEFLRLLDERQVFIVNPYLTFRGVCRFLGACPSDLDEALREDQGMGGDELICDRRGYLRRCREGREG